MGGQYLDPASNPYLGDLTKSITDPIKASLSAQFSRAGRGTSGDAARYISQGMTSGLAAPLFNQYNTERGFQHSAAQMAPSMASLDVLPEDWYLGQMGNMARLGSTGKSTTQNDPGMAQTLTGIGLTALGAMTGNPMMAMGGMGSMGSGLSAAYPGSLPGQSIGGSPFAASAYAPGLPWAPAG